MIFNPLEPFMAKQRFQQDRERKNSGKSWTRIFAEVLRQHVGTMPHWAACTSHVRGMAGANDTRQLSDHFWHVCIDFSKYWKF